MIGLIALKVLLALLWLTWLGQAFLSMLKVRQFARRLNEPRRTYHDYRPKAHIIMPIKGVQDDPAECLHHLCSQDYPNYRVVLVVESQSDPAYQVLNRELERQPRSNVEILVAGVSPPNQGQKVHNQRMAMTALNPRCGGDEVWVFADSDAVLGPHWLGQMVGPLRPIDKHGMTSGYRWLIPQSDPARGAAARPTIWSHLASVINGSVACWAGREKWNQAWGGSMAIRVAVARKGELLRRLEGALTDDYPFTHMCVEMGMPVYFVRDALVPSPVHFTLATLTNFAHRQYLITRVYAPRLYCWTLTVTAFYTVAWLAAWAALLTLLLTGQTRTIDTAIVVAVMLAVLMLNLLRSAYRRSAVVGAFGPDVLARLRTPMRLDAWATWLWMAVHLLLILRAACGRTMNWRGIRYRLRGPNEVERLN